MKKNPTWRNWLKRLSPASTGGGQGRAATILARRVRPVLEMLEERTLPSVTIAASNNSGNGYSALDFNQSGGYVPPDTCGAAGPNSYVETVNQTVAIYSPKATGASATTASLSTFWFSTGGLPHADGGSGLSDPIVTYNDQIGRFIVGDQDVDFNTHVSRFDIAVSKTNNPATLSTSDWNFYSITTTESGFDADYPGNFGYNHDAFVYTLNMFGVTGGGHVQVVSVNNADLANGVSQSSLHVYKNDLNDFSVRPSVMHDSAAGDPLWLVTEHGDNLSIDVIKMSGVLSTAATFAYTNLAVTPYSGVVHPLNPNGTAITTNIDSRIQKAGEWNHVLVAVHSVSVSSTEDDAQWYAVDLSSTTPTLKDQGRVSGGNNTYITYPSIDINSARQIGMTYMKSGNDTSTDYLSMYVTGRTSSDAAGTMETSVLVPAGKGQANYSDFSSGGRAGDLSGINVDPSDGSFWAANEFANTESTANWGTAIANFTLSTPLPTTDMAVTASGPSTVDVSNGATTATYTITITNNGPSAAQGVVLSDTLPAGSTFSSMTQTAGTDAFTLTHSGGNATETANGNIASGSSDTFSLVVNAPASLANGAAFNDTASVSASNPDSNPNNDTVTVNGTVVNNNPNADLSVSLTGPGTANEGDTVTYNITVTNAGPSGASAVTLTDTLPSLLSYKSATSSQGTFSVTGGMVTFSLGAIASGGNATASVTAQALEDGTGSDTASVSSTSPDPTTADNSASVTTTLTEPAISVSSPVRTSKRTLTNFKTATFTHASGVEPVSAFSATINWGDGTNSPGTITLSGTTYTVTGSHTYSRSITHTITTTVKETGNSPDRTEGTKFDGDNPGAGDWRDRDIVRLPQDGQEPSQLETPAGPNVPIFVTAVAAPGGAAVALPRRAVDSVFVFDPSRLPATVSSNASIKLAPGTPSGNAPGVADTTSRPGTVGQDSGTASDDPAAKQDEAADLSLPPDQQAQPGVPMPSAEEQSLPQALLLDPVGEGTMADAFFTPAGGFAVEDQNLPAVLLPERSESAGQAESGNQAAVAALVLGFASLQEFGLKSRLSRRKGRAKQD
jgi:uncharacterized repeat protein (TIGR01451 family)